MLKKIIILITLLFSSLLSFLNLSYAEDDVKWVLSEIADSKAWDIEPGWVGAWKTKDFIVNIWKKILAPIVFLVGLLIAFIGFYKLFFSDKEDERKKWLNFVLYGVIWVIISVSGYFLATTLVGEEWTSWILAKDNLEWWNVAKDIYDKIIIKFFSLFIYLVILVLFVILVINVIKLMASPDKEDTAKHAKTIIIWNAIGLIIMLAAKNIVETFYKQTSWYKMATWWAILENTNLTWLYTILNYALAFIAFAITVLIIYQAYLLLFKPDDEATYKSLKKYFVYAILGVLIIWWVYLIARFFIIR